MKRLRIHIFALTCFVVALVGLASFLLFPRTSPYLPDGFTPIPINSIEEGVNTAEIVAHEWDTNSHLVAMDSVYVVEDSQWKLDLTRYQFVSGDQRSYVWVTIKGSGRVQTNKPVVIAEISAWKNDGGRSETDSRSEILQKELLISEREALEIGWDTFGNLINEYCGPLNKITVMYSETISIDGEPLWLIEYYSRGNKHQGAFSMNAGGGIPSIWSSIPQRCLNFQDPSDLIDRYMLK